MSTKTLSPAQAARKLAFLERIFAPALEQATADQAEMDAVERARLLTQRTVEMRAAEKRHRDALAAKAAAEARHLKAQRVADETAIEAASASWTAFNESTGIDRLGRDFDARLAELGGRVIDETHRELQAMKLHANTKTRWAPTLQLGAVGYYPSGKREIADPSPLQAIRAVEEAVGEVEALRYSTLTPAEIERKCSEALQRVTAAGGRETWAGFEAHVVDLGELSKWIAKTTDDPTVKAAQAERAKEA